MAGGTSMLGISLWVLFALPKEAAAQWWPFSGSTTRKPIPLLPWMLDPPAAFACHNFIALSLTLAHPEKVYDWNERFEYICFFLAAQSKNRRHLRKPATVLFEYKQKTWKQHSQEQRRTQRQGHCRQVSKLCTVLCHTMGMVIAQCCIAGHQVGGGSLPNYCFMCLHMRYRRKVKWSTRKMPCDVTWYSSGKKKTFCTQRRAFYRSAAVGFSQRAHQTDGHMHCQSVGSEKVV